MCSLRLSVEEARNLGLLKHVDLSGSPAKGKTKARAALDKALAPRKSPKGGRHVRNDGPSLATIEFFVDHEPRTKQRARTQISKEAIVRAFLQSRGSVGEFRRLLDSIPHRSFTPKDTGQFEDAVERAASRAMGSRAAFAGPVELELVFVFAGDEGEWPTDVTDADLDNAEKAILDGLNGVLYVDDRVVVAKRGTKVCSPSPGVHVKATLLPGAKKSASRPARETLAPETARGPDAATAGRPLGGEGVELVG